MVMVQARLCSAALGRSVRAFAFFPKANCRRWSRASPLVVTNRFIRTTQQNLGERKIQKSLTLMDFDRVQKKEKETFLDVLRMYELQEPMRRGHVDFIKGAMKYMDEFGVSGDLEVYKKLMDVLPKGKFISSSPMQADFMYYPRQQQCIVDLLEKMECNGVIGDIEMEQILLNVFGHHGIPLRKFWRMMYWMPKFRNLNPWPTPRPVPNDPMVLARLAVERISSVDQQSEITVFETEIVPDSIDKTWIVSAISPDQRELLQRHPEREACYVEGPRKVWIANMPVDYFVLSAEPRERPKEEDEEHVDEDDVSKINVLFWDNSKAVGSLRSVHEQEDATIFSVCATGTSSKDSLLSWIRCLQRTNPALNKIPVLFKLTRQLLDQAEIGPGDSGYAAPSSEPVRKIGDN